jgi:rhodanese-related sulfurtransferase
MPTRDAEKTESSDAEAPAVRTYPSGEAIDRRGETGVYFVDVREADEVTDGMVPGAIHVPLERVEIAIDPRNPSYNAAFDDAAEIVFYCRSGRRSADAVRRAVEVGVERVAHVEGGIRAWIDADGPIQTVGSSDRP